MNYNQRPQIMTTSPKNLEIDVRTNLSSITIGFNTDIDQETLDGHVRLQTIQGVNLPITFNYDKRILTLLLSEPLSPGQVYQVVLIGDHNVSDEKTVGIKNVFGTPMAGSYEFSFTTSKASTLEAPSAVSPTHQSVIKVSPSFEWTSLVGAMSYQFKLSQSNTMTPLLWSGSVSESTITPNVSFEDGIYYWQVRGIDSDGNFGQWSLVFTFHLDRTEEGKVSDEDADTPDEFIQFDPFPDDQLLEVLTSFPTDQTSNVATNLQTITFHVMGSVKQEDIQLSIYGESITGEEDTTSHGKVNGTFTVEDQLDGTTLITFIPSPLSVE